MNGDSPSPAACFLRGETRIVVPSLVEELVGTIRKIARREGGDRVEDLSELSRGCLRLGDLSEERCPLFFSHGSILEGFCRISTPPPGQDLMAAMNRRVCLPHAAYGEPGRYPAVRQRPAAERSAGDAGQHSRDPRTPR